MRYIDPRNLHTTLVHNTRLITNLGVGLHASGTVRPNLCYVHSNVNSFYCLVLCYCHVLSVTLTYVRTIIQSQFREIDNTQTKQWNCTWTDKRSLTSHRKSCENCTFTKVLILIAALFSEVRNGVWYRQYTLLTVNGFNVIDTMTTLKLSPG